MYYKNILLGLIIIMLTQCQAPIPKDAPCISIGLPIEIQFGDSTLQDICFSPFEDGKIWVKVGNQNREMVEIDVSNGQKTVLDKAFASLFPYENQNGHIRNCYKDQFDSLVWIHQYDKKVRYYDQRTKLMYEVPVTSASQIIPKSDAVFFVPIQGLCYWDRKTKSIVQVSGIPPEHDQSFVMLDDNTLILDSSYTYYFDSKQLKKGISIENQVYTGPHHLFKISNGLSLFYQKDSLWYAHNKARGRLPLPSNSLSSTKIIGNTYWQSDESYFYSYAPNSKKVEKYAYRLPPVSIYNSNFQVVDGYIWIQRPGQIMVINTANHEQWHYQDRFVKAILNDCNVYLLYNDKIVCMSKEEFLKRSIPFDIKQYNAQLMQFNTDIDSLGIFKDTLSSVALGKLRYLQNKYSSIEHIEILQRLDALDLYAFQCVKYKFPDGFIACYNDKTLPVRQQKQCMKLLIDQYGRSSDFNKVIDLSQTFTKYFGSPEVIEDRHLIIVIDSTKRYLQTVANLKKTNLSEDSLYYFNALALEPICHTHWYSSDGDGGRGNWLVTEKLKSFSTKYPQSKLCDNAALYLIIRKYMDETVSDEEAIAQNEAFEYVLKQYPDSDVTATVQYYIFGNWASMSALNKPKVHSTARRFLKDFSTDRRVASVKKQLNQLDDR